MGVCAEKKDVVGHVTCGWFLLQSKSVKGIRTTLSPLYVNPNIRLQSEAVMHHLGSTYGKGEDLERV